ncbi:division plane positioning ATPase MipZ [Tistrella mobilis]|jgi:chromosome partitioning protein|uniref:Chromosome partitioning protein n=2 Tax=Tistrella mobilis TaxID=171437 RepID=I3TI25_TISMK|nr:division plane positioning ATPase MipZ [Tistrella mobilis]AFK52413.1 chromosome partitioning protein [Tistrella mobilis KA081020-065]KYO49361.1 ATPase [Tistrella mobilis]MAM73727.1 ATPase [Tistrella sp.]
MGGQIPAHIIVLGNEKGGSGKSTTAMHLAVGLMKLGQKVGVIDIDSRQRTISRYIENRAAFAREQQAWMPVPESAVIPRSDKPSRAEMEADEREAFVGALARLARDNDVVIIDSPGSDHFLARLAHSFADTLITPINDSFIDLDVLARVDPETLKVLGPSVYAEMVWNEKKTRAIRDRGTIDWVVMRNRLSSTESRNKRDMSRVVEQLSRRVGFRVAPGFGDRVIYRELFLRGLTMLDLRDVDANISLSMSHIAARHEVRGLIEALRLPMLDGRDLIL